jgi:hypothetical protein
VRYPSWTHTHNIKPPFKVAPGTLLLFPGNIPRYANVNELDVPFVYLSFDLGPVDRQAAPDGQGEDAIFDDDEGELYHVKVPRPANPGAGRSADSSQGYGIAPLPASAADQPLEPPSPKPVVVGAYNFVFFSTPIGVLHLDGELRDDLNTAVEHVADSVVGYNVDDWERHGVRQAGRDLFHGHSLKAPVLEQLRGHMYQAAKAYLSAAPPSRGDCANVFARKSECA